MLFGTALIAVVGYCVATTLHLGTIFGDRPKLMRSALIVTAATAAVHLLLIVLYAATRGVASLMEVTGGVTLGAMAVVLVYLGLTWRLELASLGSFVAPICALALMANVVGDASGAGGGFEGSVLTVHIVLAFLGTAAFALAFVFSLLYVIQESQLKQKKFSAWLRRLPSLDKLDGFALRFVGGGFAIYTISLLLGIFWAWRHGGVQFEPRSVLSVLTWVIYAVIIQTRITAGWRGRRAARLVIVGAVFAVGVIVAYLLRASV